METAYMCLRGTCHFSVGLGTQGLFWGLGDVICRKWGGEGGGCLITSTLSAL